MPLEPMDVAAELDATADLLKNHPERLGLTFERGIEATSFCATLRAGAAEIRRLRRKLIEANVR